MRRMIIALLLTTFGFASCQHRPLEDPEFTTRINVQVNISAVANVTCDVYNDKIPVPNLTPEAMRILFFDMYKDRLLADSFITDVNKDENGQIMVSGEISILPGDYRLVI